MTHRWSVGITGRLLCSFAAVAILAATANLILEHGVAVISTTYVEHGAPLAPRYEPPPATPVVAPLPTPSVAIAPPAPTLPPLDTDLLLAAIERYHRAIEVRNSIETVAAKGEVEAAVKNLDKVSKPLKTAMEARHWGTAALASRIRLYETSGNDQVGIADARRAALSDYTHRAESMEQRLTSSLQGAWKIFGRVLARQSLMQLHTQLDDMRHQFTAFTAADAEQTASTDTIEIGEAAFSKTFSGNTASFTRSEGEPWVREVRDDFSAMVELRHSIATLDGRARDAVADFDKSRGHLVDALPKPGTPAPVARASRPAKVKPTVPAVTANMPTIEDVPSAAPGFSRLSPPSSPLPASDTITTTTRAADDHDRRVVAWITGTVLAVLLLISILTVRSILIPVGRMLEATEKIAAGDVDVRIPAGGIKELDTLGVSFNRMASQLAAARDMTRDYQQRLEQTVEQRTRQLQHLAEHDPLTHLPNRRQLFVLLNHALDRAAQNTRHVAVFFMDIDNFKNLNDSLGHAFGDEVLSGIAQRLRETAQAFGFAGRLGGDEFTVVYEDAVSETVVGEFGRKLIEIFDRPLVIDGREIVVRASIGASLYPHHGRRAEDLLSAADAALFQAKALGRSRLAVFTPELLATATRKFTIEQGLRRAIEQNEFELVFQPEVSLDTLEMVLVESLIRWRLPDGRQAPPAEFLAVTEESGLIIEVGNWVLRKAIESAAEWHHGEWPQARVAINVSPRQLLDQRFADNLFDLLREFDLPARCIELELTESVLQTGPATIESLRRLRSLDIAIALDDFGTGYSSLASLENLPLTRIKLDRSLIASIDSNARAAAITTALIGLCRDLGLAMTAEGIERPEQFAALARHKSVYLQGYLIAMPVAGDAVIKTQRMIPQIMQDLLLSVPTYRPSKIEGSGRFRSLASATING